MSSNAAPKGQSRVTSYELVEVRTVLSRAKTALRTINNLSAWYANGQCCLPDNSVPHTEHELSMMRSALMTSIDVLGKVETAYGYRSAE